MNELEYEALASYIREKMTEFELPLLREQILQVTYSDRNLDRLDVIHPAVEVLSLIDALSQQIALEDEATLDTAIDRLNAVSQPERPIERILVTTPTNDPFGQETEFDLRETLADMSAVREELAGLRRLVIGDERNF